MDGMHVALPDFMDSGRPIWLRPKINIKIFIDAQPTLLVVHIHLQSFRNTMKNQQRSCGATPQT